MRLILEVGYHHLVFPQGAQVAAVIAALDGVVICDKAGYGPTEAYTPSTNYTDVGVRIAKDQDVRLPDVEKPEFLTTLQARDTELNDLRSKFYTQAAELKKALALVASVAALAPAAATAKPVSQDIPL